MNCLFQILCDEFCRLCNWLLYTYHLTCNSSFSNCTHYISYSLLNIVHVTVCVFWSDQPSLKLLLSIFLCKTYFVFEIFKGECLKILNLGKLGLKLMFWKSISSHIHAFYFLYSMLWGVFSKIKLFFSKMLFSRFSIDPICFSINRNFF